MYLPQEIFSLINKRKLVYSKSKMTFEDFKNSNITNCFPVFQFSFSRGIITLKNNFQCKDLPPLGKWD